METKFTPGPWKLIEQGDANMYGMITADNKWIISFQQNGELMTETELANAKLMAAAPDMLQSLDTVNKYFVALQNRCALTPHEEKVWKAVSLAIKNATE